MNNRGLSLIELLVSLAITSVGVLAGLGLTINSLAFSSQGSAKMEMSADFIYLGHFLTKEFTTAGGPNVPVESSYYVEDNCKSRAPFKDCAGTDRLTLAKSSQSLHCSSVRAIGQTNQITAPDLPSNPCCFESAEIDLTNRHVILTNGIYYVQKWVQAVDKNTCRLHLQSGPMADQDHVPSDFPWFEMTIVPIEISTFYNDPQTNELKRFRYVDASVDPAKPILTSSSNVAGIEEVLTDRTFDLQFSLGYDFLPLDGDITNNRSVTDEWLHNAPNKTESRTSAFFSAAPNGSLRMLSVGLAFGRPAPGKESKIQNLNGPQQTISNWEVKQRAFILAIKNTNVFNF